MNKFADGRQVSNGKHQILSDINWVACKKTDPFNPFYFIKLIEKIMKKNIGFTFVFSVAVDVLTKQSNFFIAAVCKHLDFSNDVFVRS